MQPLETYLDEMRLIHSSGANTPETSYYPTLANLLNEVGKTLKPRVRCIMGLRDQGAGLPDGGLFTPEQFPRSGLPPANTIPTRGAIEVKPAADNSWQTAAGAQVTRYGQRYGHVLVTNYRDFLLVGPNAGGQTAVLERYHLATDEAAFWAAAVHPRRLAQEQGERFLEFLKRVMLYAAPISKPQDLAGFLASYARDARLRLEMAPLPALASVRQALEQGLGLKFEGDKGEHFFRSTLVQTLFYGLFAAWVLWAERLAPADQRLFDRDSAARNLRVPILRRLFYELAEPGQMEELRLDEVLDWATAALNRVDRAAFFASFQQGQAVQYFYEPFLAAYDPELRKELGVWYTPPEIVQYMVARVDTVLRQELGLADGLADSSVYVLDPCCGTGAYLVETLRRIEATLAARGPDALAGADLKKAARERVFGFEILPAPFAIAHLQVGLFLQQRGAPLAAGERAGVYLTNSLTGWEPPQGPKQRLLFPELEAERDAAGEVKQSKPILVVLGNPPYNGFAGVAVGEERELSAVYRQTNRAPAPQGQGLNDLYVRFFRVAERRIVDATGRGVVCFISNYSWLDGLSFTGMRERWLGEFNRIWIDSLNGDKYRTGKLTPTGEPDPSVFSTPLNPEGIQVGTAVSLLVRRVALDEPSELRFRNLWGKDKLAQLAQHAGRDGGTLYQLVNPASELGLAFVPAQIDPRYHAWPSLPALLPVSYPGVKTSRDDVVVDIDRERLVARMRRYFDPQVSHEEMRRLAPGAMESTARFDAVATRDYLCRRGFLADNVVRYCYRPFDVRWLYWEPETDLLDRKRSDYFAQVKTVENLWLSAGQRNRKDEFYQPQFTRHLSDHHIVESNSSLFPLWNSPAQSQTPLFADDCQARRANLSASAESLLSALRANPVDLFHHVLAILHSPQYAAKNGAALRQDWPRVPLPAQRDDLLASAVLGKQLAALLDTETAVAGITTGSPRSELQTLGPVARAGGGSLDPAAGELALTANWGYAGQGGVTMPGAGRLSERAYDPAELAAIEAGAKGVGLSLAEVLALLGERTYDVYLNDVAYWRNVPVNVWRYTI
ncbi:MAG: N-6 DNA methylase, partial [Chloroflexi bacterium]|nr:N-6 DNA methylase [Chloroflexota bacterium]